MLQTLADIHTGIQTQVHTQTHRYTHTGTRTLKATNTGNKHLQTLTQVHTH